MYINNIDLMNYWIKSSDNDYDVMLEVISDFNMEARYGDYKYTFELKCTDEYTNTWIENIKEYLKKILYENYLSEGEEIIVPRAYCIIGKNNDEIFQETIEIPYVYMPRDNVSLKEFSYPLSQIAAPIGYDKPITEMSEEESNDYYWKYSESKIKELVKNIILIKD